MAKFAALCLVLVLVVAVVAQQEVMPSRKEMKAMKRAWKQMGKACDAVGTCGIAKPCKKCMSKCMKATNWVARAAFTQCVFVQPIAVCDSATACGVACMETAFPDGRKGLTKPAKKAANLVARECMKDCCVAAAECHTEHCKVIEPCTQEAAVKPTFDTCVTGQCAPLCQPEVPEPIVGNV